MFNDKICTASVRLDQMKKVIMPYFARLYSSRFIKTSKRALWGFKRRLANQPHRLEIFIRADDPYSYLLVQVLTSLLGRFQVEASFKTVLDLQEDMYLEPEKWLTNAMLDARRLAKLYDLDFDGKALPSAEAIEKATINLLEAEKGADYLGCAQEVLRKLWSHQNIGSSQRFSLYQSQLEQNQLRLESLGHYLSASIFYGGEWYWGIDRLDHLETRLINFGLAHRASDKVYFNRTYVPFCYGELSKKPLAETPLEVFWSARSPYSYLGLLRAHQLALYYQAPLIIKPVLPMMMRNMNVPEMKKMAIFLDTKREAEKLGIDYGFVADPLGSAVERCYALLDYARENNKLVEYTVSFAKAVNAEGIRADTDAGLRVIVERCGLDWSVAKPLLNSRAWEKEVKANVEEMLALGCWGVPTFKLGDFAVWGQDRLGLIEKQIINTQKAT